LRRLHATVERPNNPSIRGMVAKIRHLVRVEEIPAGTPGAAAATKQSDEQTARSGA
jgi:Ribosomal protein L30p/L7e